jgi:hypothetical protein
MGSRCTGLHGYVAGRNDLDVGGRVLIVIRVIVVREHDNLPDDLVQLVLSALVIAPPLDEEVETDLFGDSPGVGPGGLFQEAVVASVIVADMCQHC